MIVQPPLLCHDSPSIVAVFLMVFVYRNGGLDEEEYNMFTMANVEAESIRSDISV